MDATNYIRILALVILIGAASLTDLKSRRIPNRLTLPFALFGLVSQGFADFPEGLATSLLGFAAGFVIFLIPHVMRAMGAGDVKLMAAIGSLTNWRAVLYIALFTAVSGGILVVGRKVMTGGVIRTLKRTGSLLVFYFFALLTLIIPLPTMKQRREQYRVDTSDKAKDFMPYALAIAAGTVITLLLSFTDIIQDLTI